eukprot:TRINITY_DN3808_c0_g2_i1.p2 TRINITY_DN3808_c0_g2~~TRINITY_DN3808_c0_g2_i1.p2  ORF type:complete len:276 (+),score=22.16 TRINITY_DN3808_c0_g2_i1:69-830(+)
MATESRGLAEFQADDQDNIAKRVAILKIEDPKKQVAVVNLTLVQKWLNEKFKASCVDPALCARVDLLMASQEVQAILLDCCTEIRKRAKRKYGKPAAMGIVYAAAKTIPGTARRYSMRQVADTFFGGGWDTLRGYNSELHSLNTAVCRTFAAYVANAQPHNIAAVADFIARLRGLEHDAAAADANTSFYVYVIVSARVFAVQDQSLQNFARNVFYVGKGVGGRDLSHNAAAIAGIAPRYMRMQYLSLLPACSG